MSFSILYHSWPGPRLFVRGFFKVVIASLLFVSLSVEVPAAGDTSFPPETFLNLPIVMRGTGSYKQWMTVKEFITMQAHDSAKYEQLPKGQWICRFYFTDKLTRQSHEVSILFMSDNNEALLSRLLFDETEMNDHEKFLYVMTVDRGRKEKLAQQHERRVPAEAPNIPHVPPNMALDPTVKTLPHASVSDDLNRELEEELKKVKQFEATAKVKIPSDKTPETTLKISGTAGSNPYWAKVQSIISSQWVPPPVDMAVQTYTMTVKFRLLRNGAIKDVVVRQSSGNAFFDMAGQRAVLGPRVLPVFPAEMTDSYKDVEMIFRVESQ